MTADADTVRRESRGPFFKTNKALLGAWVRNRNRRDPGEVIGGSGGASERRKRAARERIAVASRARELRLPAEGLAGALFRSLISSSPPARWSLSRLWIAQWKRHCPRAAGLLRRSSRRASTIVLRRGFLATAQSRFYPPRRPALHFTRNNPPNKLLLPDQSRMPPTRIELCTRFRRAPLRSTQIASLSQVQLLPSPLRQPL